MENNNLKYSGKSKKLQLHKTIILKENKVKVKITKMIILKI